MISKKKLRKAIQESLNKAKLAEMAGNYKLSVQHAEDAYFLSQELEDLKGF